MSKGTDNELYRLDVEKVKADAKEIVLWIDSGITKGLEIKYKKFHDNFPIFFKNLVEKKMSIEEAEVLLDTFNRAQETFLNNASAGTSSGQ